MSILSTLSRKALSDSIRDHWSTIVALAETQGLPRGVADLALNSLPSTPLNLSGSSAKIEKGTKAGQAVLGSVVYLSGALAALVLCLWSTRACRATCLGHKSGRLAFRTSRGPQAWKTALYLGDRAAYLALARLDMARLAGRARTAGATPALRMDGASDTGIAEDLLDDARRMGVILWDYTKSVARASRALGIPGWDITLSYPGGGADWGPYDSHLSRGGRVAVVVDAPKGEALPNTYGGYPAIDGDLSDFQFLANPGVVVLLRAKGSRKNRRAVARTGFGVSV